MQMKMNVAISLKWRVLKAKLITDEQKELAIARLDVHFKTQNMTFLDLASGDTTVERWLSMLTIEKYEVVKDAMNMLMREVKNSGWDANQLADRKGGAFTL